MNRCDQHIPYPCADVHIVLGQDFGEIQRKLRLILRPNWSITIGISDDQFRALVDEIREMRG